MNKSLKAPDGYRFVPFDEVWSRTKWDDTRHSPPGVLLYDPHAKQFLPADCELSFGRFHVEKAEPPR